MTTDNHGSLWGRVAIITGAARGIGEATARKLAQEGAKLILADLDAAPLEALLGDLRAAGTQAVACVGDITSRAFAEHLVASAVEHFGGLDIIINNAGYIWPQAIHRMTDEQFDALIGVHLDGPFLLLRAAAPLFREAAKKAQETAIAHHRKVINVSSIIGLSGAPLSANYAAAKGAVCGLTRALAKEWGRYCVNVNTVAFGMISTRFNDPQTAKNPLLKIGEREINIGTMGADADAIAGQIPLGRAGTPEEAAGGIYLLCLPESDYVTGQTLVVGGGLT